MEIVLPSHGREVKVGKVLCIGRNYAKHAAEMKSSVPPEPIVFLKPSTALVGNGGTVILPKQSHSVHHEVELVVVIGGGGRYISQEEAMGHVDAYAVGLDITARDLQSRAKEKGHPWSVAKGFDTFAPLGQLIDARNVPDPHQLEIDLHINGELRQSGHTADMIFSVSHLVSYCSSIFTLLPGDLIYTGTPEGVGPIEAGDTLEARISGFPTLRVKVRAESD